MNFYYLNKRKNLFIICLMLFFLSSCLTEELENEPTIDKVSNTLAKSKSTNSSTIVIPDQVIVRYTDSNIKQSRKDSIQAIASARYNFTITDNQTCNCDIKNIELWTIDTSDPAFSSVEDLVTGLRNDEDLDDVNGDLQFRIKILIEDPWNIANYTIQMSEKVVTTNNPNAVNIAIIDTGIDYNFLDSQVLYNGATRSTCAGEISGWDFVNDDNDPMDDDNHGTIVSKIIIDELTARGTPFQLIPLKAFDHEGKGTYFNTVCALGYVLKNPDVDVVNMSFGWGEVTDAVIMENIIADLDERTLLVSSAGNRGIDTDSDGNEHFPSGFASNNLITVAGYEVLDGHMLGFDEDGNLYGGALSNDSNYGNVSIDLAAKFEFLDLEFFSPYAYVKVDNARGTSFSAAYVSARAAMLKSQNSTVSPLLLKTQTIRSGFRELSLLGRLRTQKILISNINTSGPTMSVGPGSR